MRLHFDDESAIQALPPDLQSILDQIEAADAAADLLAARLDDDQFHWQPDGGRSWSVAQCLEHLAATNLLYGDAIRTGVVLARRNGWTRRGPLAPGLVGRWFVRSLEPPVKLRTRARGSVHPGFARARDEILGGYHGAHEQVKNLVRECAAIDANRATFQNPFVKIVRVRVATGLQVIPAHDRRHLWQAEQVTRRPDFPRTVQSG